MVATLRRQPIFAVSGNVPDLRGLESFQRRVAIASRRLWESAGLSNRVCLSPIRVATRLTMDLDLTDIAGFLHSAARSVGAEVTSPWFYLQLGLILAGAGIAFAAGAAVRRRIDMPSLGAGWPAPLRQFVRVLAGSTSSAVFAALMM